MKKTCGCLGLLAGMVSLSCGANTARNAYANVSGENVNNNGDRSFVLHHPHNPSSVNVEANPGWSLANGSDSDIEHEIGTTNTVSLVGDHGEGSAWITITDDWMHTCVPSNYILHAETAMLAADISAHQLILITDPAEGVLLKTNFLAQAGKPGKHVDLTRYAECEYPDCTKNGRLVTNEVTLVVAPATKGVVTASGETKPADPDGLYLLPGQHKVNYHAVYELKCPDDMCKGGIDTNAVWDVCRLSVTNTPYLGIDLTDVGKTTNAVGFARACVEPIPENAEATYYWEFITEEHGKIGTQDDEDGTSVPYSNYQFKPSAGYENDKVQCTVTLKETNPKVVHTPCETSATASCPITVVKVDVEIEMPDAKTAEENEEIEEKYGAFVLYEKDYDAWKPFSPRGVDSLRQVKFTVEPADLPGDHVIAIGADKGYLFEKEIKGNVTNYFEASATYTLEDLTKKTFVLHGHAISERIRDRRIEICHVLSQARDVAKFTVIEMDLIPDFDRDHAIGTNDAERVVAKQKFHWWVNDDADDGDSANHMSDKGTEIPGGNGLPTNNKDSKVNGRTDLLDFFPLWTKIGHALEFVRKTAESEDANDRLTVHFRSKGLGFVMTKLTAESAGDFLNQEAWDVGVWMDYQLYHAGVKTKGNESFISQYTDLIKDRSSTDGILIMEGLDKSVDIAIELQRGQETVLEVGLNCKIHDVLDMMNKLDLWGEGAASFTAMSIADPNFASADVDVFYIHGFKVSKEFSKGWMADAFKRLHQSGSNARFTGITWPGRIEEEGTSPGLLYHRCAYKAFGVGKRLAEFFKAKNKPGNKYWRSKTIFMAHSLGNMVVSAAIQDHEMNPTQYFLLNAAVAAESYFPKMYNPQAGASRHLVNYKWGRPTDKENGYPEETYAANWYKLFEEGSTDADKSRSKLRWTGRFADVPSRTKMVNFPSSGDEVLEIYEGDIYMVQGVKLTKNPTGISSLIDLVDFSQYAWHKQEIAKGILSLTNRMKDSNMAGWGFNPSYICDVEPEKVRRLLDIVGTESLKRCPLFVQHPLYVFSENDQTLNADTINEMLACAVPAISVNMGVMVTNEGAQIPMYDMSGKKADWPSRSGYGKRWLHCDLKDVAYYYNYCLWDTFVEEGKMK